MHNIYIVLRMCGMDRSKSQKKKKMYIRFSKVGKLDEPVVCVGREFQVFKRFQNLTKFGQILDERSVQTVSTPFNIFKNKRNVEGMLNQSLNLFKFDSRYFQQARTYIKNCKMFKISTTGMWSITTYLLIITNKNFFFSDDRRRTTESVEKRTQ